MSRAAAGSLSVFLEPGGVLSPVAHSRVRVLADLLVMVRVEASVRKAGWPSFGEPALTLTGFSHLLGLKAEFIYRRHPGRPCGAVDEQTETVVILPPGHAMPIPAQRPPMGPLDSTDLWVMSPNPRHQQARVRHHDEHYVGRCNGHPVAFQRLVPAQATLVACITPTVDANKGEVKIEITGELRFERSLNLTVELCDPQWFALPGRKVSEFQAIVVAAGWRVPIARKSVSGLATPNPWISVRILEGSSRVVYEERLLGRCVRIH